MFGKEHLMWALHQREVPHSAMIKFVERVKGLTEAEIEQERELFAQEIESSFPYKPGEDPNMPGIPLAEVVFIQSVKPMMISAIRKLNVKRDPERVFLLDGRMHLGDIRETIDSEYRRKLIASTYQVWSRDGTDHDDDSYEYTKVHKTWARLKRFLEKGKLLRIWYSQAPDELCGFFHLCTLLRQYNQDFYAVHLPETAQADGKCRRVYDWAQMSKEDIENEIAHERLLTKPEIALYADAWEKLQEENAPLRATVNGNPVSVEVSFYDFWIKEALQSGEPTKTQDVFRYLNDHLGWISFSWVLRRIDVLIRCRVIEVSDKGNGAKYNYIIRLKETQ